MILRKVSHIILTLLLCITFHHISFALNDLRNNNQNPCISPKTILDTPSLYKLVRQLFQEPIKQSAFLPRRIKRFKSDTENTPSIPIIELVNSCVNNCKICIYSKGRASKKTKKHIKPFSEIKKNLLEIKKTGTKKVSLCFDFDAFSYYDKEAKKDLLDVLNEIHKLDLEIWVTTHFGSQKNQDVQRNIQRISKDLNFPLHFNISIHAWHNDVFNVIYPLVKVSEVKEQIKIAIKNNPSLSKNDIDKFWKYYIDLKYLINGSSDSEKIISDLFIQSKSSYLEKIWINSEYSKILSSLGNLYLKNKREIEKTLPKADLYSKSIMFELSSQPHAPDNIPVTYIDFKKQLLEDYPDEVYEEQLLRKIWQGLEENSVINIEDGRLVINRYHYEKESEKNKETVWKSEAGSPHITYYKTLYKILEAKHSGLAETRAELLKKHSSKFIEAISLLKQNHNCLINIVPIVSSSMFLSLNEFHQEMFDIVGKKLQIKINEGWEIEFLLGSAKQLALQFGYELPNIYSSDYSPTSKFSGIFFIIGSDGNYYLVSEAIPLERSDIRDLLGDLITNEGYSVENADFEMDNVYWYRIITPETKVTAEGQTGRLRSLDEILKMSS